MSGIAVKKTALVVCILILLLAGIFQLSSLATANPLIEERYDSPPIISIQSPENGTQIKSVLLNFTVTKSEDWQSIPLSFSYEPGSGISQKLVRVNIYLDEKFCRSVYADSNLSSPFNYSLYLKNLTDGSHIISAISCSTGVVRNWISSTVYEVPVDNSIAMSHFILDSTQPNVSFLSMAKTYATSEFRLNFTVNESVSKITYVLDGQKNVTISGNMTLSGLTFGAHNVTVYAWDSVGNAGVSETMTFTIAEPFPTTLTIGSAIPVVAVFGLGLLVYLKKRRKLKST